MALTVELERSKLGSNEIRSIPYLAEYNATATLVGIPTSLAVIVFVAKNYMSRLNIFYTVGLSISFVMGWILLIFSRES